MKIKLNIDEKDSAQLLALSQFFESLSNSAKNDRQPYESQEAADKRNGLNATIVKAAEVAKEIIEEKSTKIAEKPKKTATKTVVKEEVYVEETEEPVGVIEEVVGITTEEIRAKLQTKVGEHREAIKAKLDELKAKNVSSLDVEHYEAFDAFLDGLN